MQKGENFVRYSVIKDKNPREIVMLQGSGCQWRKCSFCDYHLDFESHSAAAFAKNKDILSNVTGELHKLEVINSGSFSELDERTMQHLCNLCAQKEISEIHFECHWQSRRLIPDLRRRFAAFGVEVKVKTGVETFDTTFRERILKKGITERDPEKIADGFDECCLLFGIRGQTALRMRRDIETALSLFERVCVNIMQENESSICPDAAVIDEFMREIYPLYADNPRVDILLRNTDYGVGGAENDSE